MRIGHGYDVHRLVEDRPLILGGVTIPHEKGLEGHSDADAVIHALCDAILGALCSGDIGNHFPDTDPELKNVDSRLLLKQVFSLMNENDYELGNADITILAQAPKMAGYIPAMREILASDLKSKVENINIKATTTEKMGFVGLGEGIAAHAVVLLKSF
ncbi:MAG: 2-C-methyl-D-erythritol 2,4-cyclodiphosphate synthase [Proteobacteria bacterium]|nr:2-C-methyl-D-erythritol 2,4-cyclodiphosphate synthase [Pseudomonadota bacterium]NOG61285.1 2-C-methyl-D-erythritol 2,4-cyclodiphosphate synthase [Pseudomonadota bacterium]